MRIRGDGCSECFGPSPMMQWYSWGSSPCVARRCVCLVKVSAVPMFTSDICSRKRRTWSRYDDWPWKSVRWDTIDTVGYHVMLLSWFTCVMANMTTVFGWYGSPVTFWRPRENRSFFSDSLEQPLENRLCHKALWPNVNVIQTWYCLTLYESYVTLVWYLCYMVVMCMI